MLNTIKRKKRKYEFTLILLFIPWVITSIVFVVLGLIAWAGENDLLLAIAVTPFAIVTTAIAKVRSDFKKNSLKFKELFVVDHIQKILPDLVYLPNEGLTFEELEGSKLLPRFKQVSSEDMIMGSMNHLSFKCSDITLFQKNEKNSKIQVFQGRYFIFDLKTNLREPVYVIPKTDSLSLEHYHKIETEWIKFNHQFIVYSTHEKDAFIALTPRFMERLSIINGLYQYLSFGFFEDKLHISFHSNVDSLDLRLFKPLNEAFLNLIVEEIMIVKNLITDLK